jgi:predicted PurR-regulated permease PerM
MRHDNLYTFRQQKRLTLWLLLFLSFLLVYALRGFISSFFGAVIIYTLFRSWHLKLVEKYYWKPTLSTSLMMVISFVFIILPFGIIVLEVADKLTQLGESSLFSNLYKQLQAHPLYHRFKGSVAIKDQLGQAGQFALDLFTGLINSVLNGVASIAVMYLMLFFMFADYKKMESFLLRYLPFSTENSLRFAEELRNITFSSVIGLALLSTIQGILVGVGFWLFDIPQPLLYGLISIFAAFLPVVGSALVFVPGAVYALITGNTFGGVAMLIWGFGLVANIDNVMRIVISKQLGGIHPLITFLGIIVGLPLFGLTGLVIGPLMIAFFILLVRIYLQSFMGSEHRLIPPPQAPPEAMPTAIPEKQD